MAQRISAVTASNIKSRRILIIRLSSLGDIVLASPLIRRLRERFPEGRIDMLSRESYSDLLAGFERLDGGFGLPRRALARWKMCRKLKPARYHTIIDLQNSITSRMVSRALKPQQLFRFHRPRWNRWLRIRFPGLRARLKVHPQVALGYMECAGLLGVFDDGFGLELTASEPALQKTEDILSRYHADNGLPSSMRPLILAPGAKHQTKIWLNENWVELMKSAYRHGFQSQVIVGDRDDAQLVDTIIDQVEHPVLNTVGSTCIDELIAWVKLGIAVVSSDSGPMHIAAALDVPLVAIFGPTVTEFGFAPFRCRSRIVEVKDLDCRPCHAHGTDRCPRRHFRCMKDIDVETVFKALTDVANHRHDECALGVG